MAQPTQATKIPGYIEVAQSQWISGEAPLWPDYDPTAIDADPSQIDFETFADGIDMSGPYNVEAAAKKAISAINPYNGRDMPFPGTYWDPIQASLVSLEDNLGVTPETAKWLGHHGMIANLADTFLDIRNRPGLEDSLHDVSEALAYVDLIQPQITAAADAIAGLDLDFTDLRTLVAQIPSNTDELDTLFVDLDDSIDAMLAAVGAGIPDSAAFELSRRGDLARSYNRIMGPLVEGNGVIGTVMPNWAAIIEAEHLNAVSLYSENRIFEIERVRAAALQGAAQLRAQKISLRREVYDSIDRSRIAAAGALGQALDIERLIRTAVVEARSRVASAQGELVSIRNSVHEATLRGYTTEVENHKVRLQFLLENMRIMSNLYTLKVTAAAQLYDAQSKFWTSRWQAEDTYIKDTIEADAKELEWDLDVLTKAMGVLGATAGITPMRQGMSKNDKDLMMMGTMLGIATSGLGAMMPMAGMLIPLLSDERLKENITEVSSLSELMESLKIYSFTYTEEAEKVLGPIFAPPTPQTGFLAQEVEKVLPGSVVEVGGIKLVQPMGLVAVLWSAVTELTKKVEELEKKNG